MKHVESCRTVNLVAVFACYMHVINMPMEVDGREMHGLGLSRPPAHVTFQCRGPRHQLGRLWQRHGRHVKRLVVPGKQAGENISTKQSPSAETNTTLYIGTLHNKATKFNLSRLQSNSARWINVFFMQLVGSFFSEFGCVLRTPYVLAGRIRSITTRRSARTGPSKIWSSKFLTFYLEQLQRP